MSSRTRASDGSVTGVATGNLGTGTALDDTQVYSVDALASEDHPGDAAIAALPVRVEPSDVEPNAESPSIAPRAAPAQIDLPVPRTATRRPPGRHRITGGYPVGVLTAAVVALIAVAAVLTLRDGGLVGGAGTGPGLAGAASFPPPPSFGALKTAAPAAKPATGGHGHGHGHGPH